MIKLVNRLEIVKLYSSVYLKTGTNKYFNVTAKKHVNSILFKNFVLIL